MLHIHRSERADVLVDVLGGLVTEPIEDVMGVEIVAVPSRGIERWLSQQLSSRLGVTHGRADGVCANVDFPFPGALVGRALATASGVDPDIDPWRPERSVWPLIDVVDGLLDEPWLAPLAGHLRNAGPADEVRRFATVRHIADLYDRYGVHRPEMLRLWAAGEDHGIHPRQPLAGGSVAPAARADRDTEPGRTSARRLRPPPRGRLARRSTGAVSRCSA